MLSPIGLAPMCCQADVDLVLQEVVESAARKRLAAIASAIGCYSRFADNLADLQFFAQFAHAAQSTIAPEYVADGFGFPFIHNELAVLNIQPQRRQAAHPHALLFGSSNLVADTLARDLPFKLRKGQEHIEGQPAHAGCRVEGLGDGDE